MNAIRHNVWKLYAIRLLYWMHFVSAVLVPFFRDWGGISLSAILFLNAWFMAWNFLLEIPTGSVADTWTRKASLGIGVALGAVATGIIVSTPRLEVFLVAEIVSALSMTLMSGADEALLYDSLAAEGREDRATRAFARAESFKLVGILVGALAGASLATWIGLRGTMALQAIPMSLAALLTLSLVEPPRREPGRRARYLETLRAGVAWFRGHEAVRIITFDMVALGAVAWWILWLYQPMLGEAGLSIGTFGAVHAALVAGQIAVLQLAPRVESMLGSRRAFALWTALGMAAGWGVLAMTHNPWVVVPTVVAVAGLGIGRGPLLLAHLNGHVPSSLRATVVSTASAFRTLAIVIGNGVAALAVQSSLATAAALACVLAVTLALASPLRERHLHADPAEETD